MFDYLVLLFILAIPALIAYIIALFGYKRLVKTANSNPRRARTIIFIVSYLLLLAAEVVVLLNSLSFER